MTIQAYPTLTQPTSQRLRRGDRVIIIDSVCHGEEAYVIRLTRRSVTVVLVRGGLLCCDRERVVAV